MGGLNNMKPLPNNWTTCIPIKMGGKKEKKLKAS